MYVCVYVHIYIYIYILSFSFFPPGGEACLPEAISLHAKAGLEGPGPPHGLCAPCVYILERLIIILRAYDNISNTPVLYLTIVRCYTIIYYPRRPWAAPRALCPVCLLKNPGARLPVGIDARLVRIPTMRKPPQGAMHRGGRTMSVSPLRNSRWEVPDQGVLWPDLGSNFRVPPKRLRKAAPGVDGRTLSTRRSEP